RSFKHWGILRPSRAIAKRVAIMAIMGLVMLGHRRWLRLHRPQAKQPPLSAAVEPRIPSRSGIKPDYFRVNTTWLSLPEQPVVRFPSRNVKPPARVPDIV